MKHRELTLTKMKRRIVERATISILEDMERMPMDERARYLETRGELMEQVINRDPEYIQFGTKVDVD